jgi:hypothetical protein
MAYFEGITPADIELYDSSGLGSKIPIWFRDMGLFLAWCPVWKVMHRAMPC